MLEKSFTLYVASQLRQFIEQNRMQTTLTIDGINTCLDGVEMLVRVNEPEDGKRDQQYKIKITKENY